MFTNFPAMYIAFASHGNEAEEFSLGVTPQVSWLSWGYGLCMFMKISKSHNYESLFIILQRVHFPAKLIHCLAAAAKAYYSIVIVYGTNE